MILLKPTIKHISNVICTGDTSLRNSQICVDATVLVVVLQSVKDLGSPNVANVFRSQAASKLKDTSIQTLWQILTQRFSKHASLC